MIGASISAMSLYAAEKPNVILILTDDQGYGDFGFTGNPNVKTPTIDKLASQSVQLKNFFVSPVSAPTRSSLITGRYSLRTGITDTYNGGATMSTNEYTIAEELKSSGYTTGIFGKWHLGDNYPCRPSDQGFDEALIHLSGGMGQVGDFTTYFQKDSSYFNPVLWHNNKQEKYKGYCTDIFATEAIKFIEKNKNQNFFCYLSFNAPHTPLQVPDDYYQKFKNIDPTKGFSTKFPELTKMSVRDKESARKVYAMVNNIDDNLKKLFSKLKELEIEDNTIIIFMTDNGPQHIRYKNGLKGKKSKVYQGGIKVPCLIKYQKKFKTPKNIEQVSAHIDILPTILNLCRVKKSSKNKLDGIDLTPYIESDKIVNRELFFYWSRHLPELYENMAYQDGHFKLVGNCNYNSDITSFELYNINKDSREEKNIISTHKNKAENLKSKMDKLFKELIESPNMVKRPTILIGTKHENPTYLNRNDAGGERAIWNQKLAFGFWDVDIQKAHYDIEIKFTERVKKGGKLFIEIGNFMRQIRIHESTDLIKFNNLEFPKIEGQLKVYYLIGGYPHAFPFLVKMEKI
jgi:arylsulfatase A-like enzyme